MAQGRKYAGLIDLDSAPDVYDTGDVSSQTEAPQSPTSTASTPSSSDNENELESSKPSRIDRHSNRPSAARDTFSRSRVDARDVDFSDRISDQRKSYRVPLGRGSRRRRRPREDGGYVDEYGDFSDDEEEGFEARVARLRREIEEVRVEGARRAQEGAANANEESEDGIVELGTTLSAVQAQSRSSRPSKQKAAAAPTSTQNGHLRNGDGTPHPSEPANKPTADATTLSQDISSTSDVDIDRILIKAAAFETRLTLLEDTLGANSFALPPHDTHPQSQANKNVLTTLSVLETQFASLSTTTVPSLESMAAQIRQLTAETSRLEEARRAAREAQEVYASKSPSPVNTRGALGPPAQTAPLPEDPEQKAKIDALFATLPTIEAVSPLLPSVLERLKSLRVLHADAAVASENLAELEKQQARVGDEMGRWREGVERVESAMTEAEETGERNRDVVEGWVRDLEGRLKGLDS